MANDKKNTLLTPQSTKPFVNRVPPKNPLFDSFPKPKFAAVRFNPNNRGKR